MKASFALFWLATTFAFVQCNRPYNSNNYSQASYEEKVMTVEEMERADPARFLKVDGKYKENFWGDKMKLDATVENTATVANFKDVVLEVKFYSTTETVLDTRRYVLYEYVPAHKKKFFSWKLDRPANCTKLGVDVVSAKAY